jgi:hypothetical protein
MAYAHYGSHCSEWDSGVEPKPMTIRATPSVFLPIAGAVAAMAGDRYDAHLQVRLIPLFRSVSRDGCTRLGSPGIFGVPTG